jgi:hypothetical protein
MDSLADMLHFGERLSATLALEHSRLTKPQCLWGYGVGVSKRQEFHMYRTG